MNRQGFIARGGMWFVAQLALMAAEAVLGPAYAGAHRSDIAISSGGALMSLGAIIGVAGVHALGRHTSPLPRPRANTRLIRHGIYRWIRHPLYASLMCLAPGWAWFWWSWPALVTAVVLIIFLDRKSRREERWMSQRFAEYEEYQRTTTRYVPGVI